MGDLFHKTMGMLSVSKTDALAVFLHGPIPERLELSYVGLRYGPTQNSTNFLDNLQDLIEEHRARMQAYAYVIVKNFQDAEDIVQNVVLIALKKNELLEHENPLGWLLQTTKFEAMNHYRKHRKVKVGLDPEVITLLENSIEEDATSTPHPFTDKVKWCLKQLKEKYRKMFKLRYEDNLKGEALAKACGLKKDALYKSLSRCQVIVKQCLERNHND